ncbi:MAG: hypothetical protein Q4D16_07445 [Eubacteriales bacterium]|nr:hypothetical protein [Eubacteriales bacterium]
MSINIGTIMFAAGIAGMIICMIVLYILPKIFEKQRKKLMEEIEAEI